MPHFAVSKPKEILSLGAGDQPERAGSSSIESYEEHKKKQMLIV